MALQACAPQNPCEHKSTEGARFQQHLCPGWTDRQRSRQTEKHAERRPFCGKEKTALILNRGRLAQLPWRPPSPLWIPRDTRFITGPARGPPAEARPHRLTLKLPGEPFLAGIVFPIVRVVWRPQRKNVSAHNKYCMNPEMQGPLGGSKWNTHQALTLEAPATGSFMPHHACISSGAPAPARSGWQGGVRWGEVPGSPTREMQRGGAGGWSGFTEKTGKWGASVTPWPEIPHKTSFGL